MTVKRWLVVGPVGVIGAGMSWAGVAAAIHDGNTIHACAKVQGGDVRLVDDEEECLNSEELVEWSVEGPQGPAGPQGPSGVVETHVHVAEETAGPEVLFFGVTAMCGRGEVALSGGYSMFGPALSDAQIRLDRPVSTDAPGVDPTLGDGDVPQGWQVFLNKPSADPQELTLTVWVACAPTS
jgi:hypothetical protein